MSRFTIFLEETVFLTFIFLGRIGLNLREDPKKGVFVESLHEEKVKSLADTIKYFEIGMSHRATAETRLNERSSRSHGIFTMKVEYSLDKQEEDAIVKESSKKRRKKIKLKKRSVVHFVDLAGSER